MSDSCRVAVVGAGAAGFLAAFCASRAGAPTVLLEKNTRPGLKILISGGGRCNLTTTRSGRDLESQYGARRGRWLRHALRAFPPADLVRMVDAAGVPLREEDLEKVFPASGRARDVLDALLRLVREAGVDLHLDRPMQSVRRLDGGFEVATPAGPLWCERLIVASGGLSYPKTGSTGDGYRVAEAFGHCLVPQVPHLAPLAIEEEWVRELAGIVVEPEVAAVSPAGEVLCRRRRPLLFTHKGLSGPAAMDLSGFVEESGGGCRVRIDFAPETTREELLERWKDAAAGKGRQRAASLLPGHLPERLRNALTRLAGAEAATAAELPRGVRHRLLEQVKATHVPVERSLGFAHAEVTRGGVCLDEIDARTMQSRRQPGLYFCGEVLDVDGPIGGFNFQSAFATGRLAGLHAGRQEGC